MKINSSLLVVSLVLTSALSLVGCATGKFDADRAKTVKRVALISFEIHQQQPKDALGLSKLGELKNGRPGDSEQLQSMARNVFKTWNAQMEKTTGWRALPLTNLVESKTYAQKVQQAMSGARLVSMTGGSYELVPLKGVLDAMAFKRLSHSERAAYAKSLGADAFASVVIYQTIDQGWSIGNLTGDAAFAFTSRANMDIYGLESEEPIWRIQNVDGPKSERSDKLPGNPGRLERLASIGEKSASSAIETMVGTYKR